MFSKVNWFPIVFGNIALILIFALGGKVSLLKAQDYCALIVDLQSANGSPAKSVPVRLYDPQGKLVLDELSSGPRVRVCDFGFGPHSLQIGYNHCFPTTFPNLRLRLGRPISLSVRLQRCEPDTWEGSCSLYLRISDGADRPLEGVALLIDRKTVGLSDPFGRVEGFFLDQTVKAKVAKTGYGSQELELHCSQGEVFERALRLERLP